MDEKDVMRTGTTTVGLVCKDGLVLAADKRATAGDMIINKRVKKIYKITDKMAVTLAGTVSDVQLLVKLIKAELSLKDMRTERKSTVKEAANLLAGMVYANIRKFSLIPGVSHFILGGVDNIGFHMYDLFPDGSITECTDYLCSGSGSVFALGVLETLYKNDLSVKEGSGLAVKAINAALQRDIASGGGIDVVTITKDGIKQVLEKEVDTTLHL